MKKCRDKVIEISRERQTDGYMLTHIDGDMQKQSHREMEKQRDGQTE